MAEIGDSPISWRLYLHRWKFKQVITDNNIYLLKWRFSIATLLIYFIHNYYYGCNMSTSDMYAGV